MVLRGRRGGVVGLVGGGRRAFSIAGRIVIVIGG
jgi:hypothetical protein